MQMNKVNLCVLVALGDSTHGFRERERESDLSLHAPKSTQTDINECSERD